MIVLMTDFGESEYVGVMKGVILSVTPSATLVDLTHSISPQCILEGAWVLYQSYRYFPPHSVFLAVVDPGVGTQRDCVVVKTRQYVFIGPDNGLLYPAASSDGIESVYRIHVPSDASPTFHGRDVFARVAAEVVLGRSLTSLGTPKRELDVRLQFHLDGRCGQVVRIDRFGNIITNIPPSEQHSVLLTTERLRVSLPVRRTYSDGPDDEPFVIVGSHGTMEITVKNGRADSRLSLRVGDLLTLE